MTLHKSKKSDDRYGSADRQRSRSPRRDGESSKAPLRDDRTSIDRGPAPGQAMEECYTPDYEEFRQLKQWRYRLAEAWIIGWVAARAGIDKEDINKKDDEYVRLCAACEEAPLVDQYNSAHVISLDQLATCDSDEVIDHLRSRCSVDTIVEFDWKSVFLETFNARTRNWKPLLKHPDQDSD